MTSDSQPRKLYKDPTNKMIAGVASGVAKYFDLDVTLVRVVWFVACFFAFLGVVVYVVLWIVLDDAPADVEGPPAEADAGEATGSDETTAAETDEGGGPSETNEGGESNPEAGDVSAG